MARRRPKVLPARKAASRDDDSLLTRSAESLGRVIGSLQRQMQDGTKRMSTMAEDARSALPELPKLGRLIGKRAPAARKASPRRAAAAKKKSPSRARKTAGARARKATARKR